MSSNFVQSSALRTVMLAGYRAFAQAQVWRKGPRIFVNSLPKAGTHLLLAELARFDGMQNSALHLDAPKIRLKDQITAEGFPVIDLDKVDSCLSRVRKGQFFSAHLYWTEELERLLSGRGVAMLFVVRDPRDILLSQLHYAVGLRRHRLHEFLAGIDTEEDRLRALIRGNAHSPFLRPMRANLEQFLPWTQSPAVLTVRFEDLVGAAGGGTIDSKHLALRRIAAHCGLVSGRLDAQAATRSGPTPTLRKGKIGGWRKEMPATIVQQVNEACGDLLEAYGYEQ
jgi:hypothetical protein